MKILSKNRLDERQEQELLKIEHNGCWLAFWGLAVLLMVEGIVRPGDFSGMIGEWVVFMALCLYLAIACIRRGIWDRRIPATGKATVIESLIAGLVVFALVCAACLWNGTGGRIAVLAGVMSAVFTAVLCAVVLALFTSAYARRRKELEEEPESEDNQI